VHVRRAVGTSCRGRRPYRIEHQAELIVRAPLFMQLLEEFLQLADEEPEDLRDNMTKLAQVTRRILSEVTD